jgi:hypothetical protein
VSVCACVHVCMCVGEHQPPSKYHRGKIVCDRSDVCFLGAGNGWPGASSRLK